MKLLRSFPPLTFALVLLSITGLCVAQKSMGLLLIAGTLAALSWYITEGPRGRTLPRWVSNILVIAVSLNVFVDLFQHRDDVLGVLGRFAVWLTLIKLYERRNARDHAHLLTLSLLLMMTGCLMSSDLIFGVILLAYAALGLYALLLYQLYSSFELNRDARQAAIPAEYRLVPPLKPIMGSQAALRFRTQAAGVAVVGLLISFLVFVMFPRDVGANMLGRLPSPAASQRAQFAWSVDLDAGGRITDSRIKVMSVKLTNHRGQAIHPTEPLLLRGAVLDDYAGKGRWRSAGQGSVHERVLPDANSDPSVLGSRSIVQQVTLNRSETGVVPLFCFGDPQACSTDPKAIVMFDDRRRTLKTVEGTRRVVGYTIVTQPGQLNDASTPARGRSDWRSGRAFDDSSGRVTDLARSLLKNAGLSQERPRNPEDRWQWSERAAGAFTDFLQSGMFTYTTDLSGITRTIDEDPVTRFLTTTRRGHCEYFACGLVALCHSVGIPARVVVGYVAYDYDESLAEYSVLERNAHAWAEVLIGHQSWREYDPTPPATLVAIHNVPSTLTDTVRNLYQNFEGNWSDTIIGFDAAAQNSIADSFNRNWTARLALTLESARNWMEQVNAFFNVGPGGYIWMGIVGLALIIAIVALVKLMRRSLAIRRALQLQHLHGREYQRMLRQLGFYLDMLGVLKRRGMAKPHWQPPMNFAAQLSHEQPNAAALVREITSVFYAARYGQQSLDGDQRRHVQELVERLAKELHD